MAHFDPNGSLMMLNFGRFLQTYKSPQKLPLLVEFISLKNRQLLLKVAQLAKNCTLKLPFLVEFINLKIDNFF
jgi:hypothetical protein